MRFLAALAALFLLITPVAAAPTFPALTGRVVDQANILSPTVEADLTQKLAALEAGTSRQLVVVTLASLQGYEISDYGYQLGRAWGIGQKKGALFIIAPQERAVRVEVGYGLEPILTDALSSVIIQSQVLPNFRQGNMEAGVQAGTAALIQQLSLERSEAEARAAAAAKQRGSQQDEIPDWLAMLLILGVFGFMFYQSWAHPGRRGGGGGPYYGGGGWGGGGGRGGFGGGGFGGGGGGFGGGGASGRW